MSAVCITKGVPLKQYLIVFILLVLVSCNKSQSDPIQKTGLHLIPATGKEIISHIKNTNANVVLVNAWATWCQPCVEEFPDIMALHKKYKDQGLKIIFISADFENQTDNVLAFLKEQGVDFPTYLKSGKDMAFINTIDPNWSGALPATWIFDSSGKKRHYWEGKASHKTIEAKLRDVLNN